MLRTQRGIQVVDHLQISFFPGCCCSQMHTTLLQFNLPQRPAKLLKESNLIRNLFWKVKNHWNAHMKKALQIWQPSHKRKHCDYNQEAMTRSSCSQVVLVVETVTQRMHLWRLFDLQVVRQFSQFQMVHHISWWFMIWFVSASCACNFLPLSNQNICSKVMTTFKRASGLGLCQLLPLLCTPQLLWRNANLEAGLILSSAK